MKQKIYPVAIVIIILTVTSCVSKKKFVEMESFKNRAENRVRELTDENTAKEKRIETMVSDFEKMKGELMESNAIKNHQIDSLSGKINVLSSDVSEKASTIEEKIFAFEYEKRRLTEDAANAKRQIKSKETELENLSAQLGGLKNEITRLNFDFDREKSNSKSLEGQLQLKEEKILGNQQVVEKLNTEIQNLRKQLSEKDQAIEKLENNVKLLKSQLK